MRNKEFMEQKAKDMSIEELAYAIKIKTTGIDFRHKEISIQEEDSRVIGIKILLRGHDKNPFSYPLIHLTGRVWGGDGEVFVSRSIPALKEAIKKVERINEED